MNERLSLMTSQRNQVKASILAARLDPALFEWKEVPSGTDINVVVSELRYKNSRFYYQFAFKNRKHFCFFSPGAEVIQESQYPGDWNIQLSYVQNWLVYLKREIQSPDLWSSASSVPSATAESLSTSGSNAPLTPSERTSVLQSLQELRTLIAEKSEATQDQLQTIDDRIAYLADASERLGRKDWLNAAIGVLVNLAIGAVIPPEVAREALATTWHAMRWLIEGTPLLPKSLG